MSSQEAKSTRRDILMATLRLIGEQGCDGLSHRKIAQEAGVSLGSTTYHFASREELLLEAFRLYMTQFGERLSNNMHMIDPGPDADPAEQVANFLVQLVEDEFSDRNLLRAEIELILYSAKHLALSVEFAAWEAGMAKPLTEFLARKDFAEPKELALALMRLTRGFEIQALSHPEVDTAGFRRQLMRVLGAYRHV